MRTPFRLRTLKRLWRIFLQKPYIAIGEYGQLTDRPKVSVGFHSTRGMCGALTFAADDAGHASASSYARTYAHITGLPIVDRRAKPEITP
jgi:hypothetical protein